MSALTMQAIRVHRYGGPEQLKLEQQPRPAAREGEVLVRVHAAGVNPIDWKTRQGFMKDFFPMTFPYIPGIDVAGEVEGVGFGVTTLKIGQAVFGRCTTGTYAEYITASEELLAPKPSTASFAEAAAIPTGATTAWQALFDEGNLQAGQRVLIVGAAGGLGAFAVQLAKWKGAQVIGTTSTANLEFVRSLGADQVIDYTTTQVESVVQDVDLVLDGVGGASLFSSLTTIRRGGTLISLAEQPPQEQARACGVRAMMIAARTDRSILQTVAQLIDEGQLNVIVGKAFSLSEAQQAHECSQSGHGRGRIVLHVN
ncbi:NADPH:quinone reductase [Reticulibacter mediterranei]|uniref:NADPH:quinone reductase n=1 Tax=Reticulibacter mediterranei TaxID=2778369 RepID=A0A8J3IMG7_9CHLR|nr:NADP-dependent oxidoreductase [Reticulibacter mediterranei]GHO98294.1 NADPH:quinone reductase [Reticulibacter mediterranei]